MRIYFWENMIRLQLESQLEAGLYGLGAELGRRVYALETDLGRDIDDDLTGINSDELSKPEALVKLFDNAISDGQLLHTMGIPPPYFTRKSNPINGYTIDYEVRTDGDKQRLYHEGDANQIIKEGKIIFQSVGISQADRGLLICIDIVSLPHNTFGITPRVLTRDELPDNLHPLTQLHGTIDDLAAVYQSVIDSLRD